MFSTGEILDNESLPLSLVKKKVVSAAKSSSPIVVPKMSQQRFEDQDIEDVPLSKLKAMKSFEDYLKELPKDVKQIVNKTLKVRYIFALAKFRYFWNQSS